MSDKPVPAAHTVDLWQVGFEWVDLDAHATSTPDEAAIRNILGMHPDEGIALVEHVDGHVWLVTMPRDLADEAALLGYVEHRIDSLIMVVELP